MSDLTQTTDPSTLSHADDDDPLQANQVVLEAFQVVHCDTQSVQEEAQSLASLTTSYEAHVSHYTDALAKVLDDTLQSYETEVDHWQAAADKAQETLNQHASPSVSDTAHSVIDHITALRNHLAGNDDDAGEESDASDDASPKDKP